MTYYRQNYDWPVIEHTYIDTVARLDAERRADARPRMEPLPDWWTRTRCTLRPGAAVVERLARGPEWAAHRGVVEEQL